MRLSDFLDFTKDKDLSGIMISIEVRIYTNIEFLSAWKEPRSFIYYDDIGCHYYFCWFTSSFCHHILALEFVISMKTKPIKMYRIAVIDYALN